MTDTKIEFASGEEQLAFARELLAEGLRQFHAASGEESSHGFFNFAVSDERTFIEMVLIEGKTVADLLRAQMRHVLKRGLAQGESDQTELLEGMKAIAEMALAEALDELSQAFPETQGNG